MAIRQNVLSYLNKTGLNFDNGYGYTDDESYHTVRNVLSSHSEIMKYHAHNLKKYANSVTDGLGIDKSKVYITMYGCSDYIVMTNSNHSYIKITLCSDGDFLIFMGDENILRPNERVKLTYGVKDNGIKNITDLLSSKKVLDVVKRFNEGEFL